MLACWSSPIDPFVVMVVLVEVTISLYSIPLFSSDQKICVFSARRPCCFASSEKVFCTIIMVLNSLVLQFLSRFSRHCKLESGLNTFLHYASVSIDRAVNKRGLRKLQRLLSETFLARRVIIFKSACCFLSKCSIVRFDKKFDLKGPARSEPRNRK